MKKTVFLFLALALLLSLFTSCSGGIEPMETAEAAVSTGDNAVSEENETEEEAVRAVANPMSERPNYVLPANASPDEIRAMAVKAMRDELSIVWYPDRDASYTFISTSTAEMKDFTLKTQTNYAGLPYTNAITGIFQFLEYYDGATGRVKMPQNAQIDFTLGNQCAGSVIWGWAACVSSVRYKGIRMSSTDGLIPVGDYIFDTSTMETCKTNGEQTMYKAYAEIRPADYLVSGIEGDNHVVMAVESAVAVQSGGVIDGKESYVVIQDQRGGARQNTNEYVKEENGEKHHYSGRTYAKISFEYLYSKGYIAYTCAEFLGQKPYTVPGIALDREIASFEDLAAATLSSEYYLTVFTIVARDAQGKEVYRRSMITDYSDMTSGNLNEYPLSQLALTQTTLSRNATEKGELTLEIRCLDATGTEFEVARFNVTV